MGGIDVGTGGGKRRTLDSEINMIPMIDLLMVTISFLLITAVWTHMARVNASAQVPGKEDPTVTPPPPKKQLHVEMRTSDKFVLLWKTGNTTINSVDVPRQDVIVKVGTTDVVRFPDLADRIEAEWKTNGEHQLAEDKDFDTAVLHTDNKTEYKFIVAVIDAIYKAKRDLTVNGKTERVTAFNVSFAVN